MQPLGRWFRALCASRVAAPAMFFAVTAISLGVVPLHATLHLDTARDLLLARDCVLEGLCGVGPPSSFAGWTQGALWSHLLELRESLGLGFAALEWAVCLALACAAALVPVAARATGRTVHALTWALWFAATLPTIGYPTLWNPTLLPLASGLFCAALLHAARSRSAVAFVGAAAAVAICVDLHLVSAVLVPFLLATAVACAARPLVVVPGAAVMMVLVSAASSPAAFAANWPLVSERAPIVVVVLVLAAVVGATMRRALRARDGRARADVVLLGLCIYMVAVPLLLAVLTGHPLYARYLAGLVTPAAIVLSTRAGDRGPPRAWVRCTAVGVVLAGYLAFVVGERVMNPLFRLVEAERVAAALYAGGASYGELYRHLRGPDAIFLLATLAALEPAGSRDGIGDERDILVVRAQRDELPAQVPASWTVITLDSRHVAVIVPYVPWMRLAPLAVCFKKNTTPDCEGIDLEAGVAKRAGTRWADRAYPSVLEHRPRPGESVSYRMSVHAASAGPARRLQLVPDRCKGWRINADNGGEGDSVAIAADGAVHEVVFTVEAGRGCRWWLPPVVEIEAGDTALAQLLAQR